MKVLMTMLLTALAYCLCWAQSISVETEYYTNSNFKLSNGSVVGSGNLSRSIIKFDNVLTYIPVPEKYGAKIWALSGNVTYAYLGNNEIAKEMNPRDVLNASVNLSYITPINTQWTLLMSLGVGIYAEPKFISWNTILANGAALAVYQVSPTFKIGFGGTLTNSYGPPAIMPAVVFDWSTTSGKYEIKIGALEGIKAEAAMALGEKLRLSLTGVDLDAISAVTKVDGKEKIYSSTLIRSYLTPSWQPVKGLNVSMSFGICEWRSCQLSKRRFGYFYKNMFKKEHRFNASFFTSLGIRYNFGN